jgi:CO/xanthine dehydrogenase Mo-binding subunit
MRGYGSPQAIFAQQRQLHSISKRLGIDIITLQRKNLIRPEDVDIDKVGNPRPLDCMERGLELFDWSDKNKWKLNKKEKNNSNLRQEHQDLSRKNKRGIGFAIGCHGNGVFGAHRDFVGLRLKMNDDGTMVLESGTHDMGNSLITSQLMILAEELGIEVKDIAVVESDTDLTPWNLGDYSSRGVFVTGAACIKLAGIMREKLCTLASALLEEPVESLQLQEGKKVISASGKEVSFADLLLYSHRELQEDVMVSTSYASQAGRTSFGAHFAQVEVDEEQGIVRILDYVAVHDVGQAINRLSLEGQLEGGIQMGLGYALSEKMDFDERGRLKNSNLKKYKMFKASMMPDIKLDFIEEGEVPGPFGGKSIGECATVPVAPAIVNAVADALGYDFHSMPLDAECLLEIEGCES